MQETTGDLFKGGNGPLAARTSSSVADIIRHNILAGALQPGQPLLERNIAQDLGVSRTPVREALFILQGEGLIELVPRKYARVRRITQTEVTQIYSLRRTLEMHSAQVAAAHADAGAILEIETALIRQRNLSKDCSAIEQAHADLAFHASIANATGSPLVKTVVNQVLSVTATLRSRLKYESKDLKQALKAHRDILAAIKAGDGATASALMGAHIDDSLSRVKVSQVVPE